MDTNFRAFWLAPVPRNIPGHSLFWEGIQNGFSFRDSFERRNFSGKWSSYTDKYQETKFGLSVFTGRQKKIFLMKLKQNHKKWSPKQCQLKRKQTLSDVFYSRKVPFWFLSNWFDKYQKLHNYPPKGRFIALDVYVDASLLDIYSTTIHLHFEG